MSSGPEIYKAIVIGSGAGGAPVAARLARQWGEGVALLEAGPHVKAPDLTQIERDMLRKLYVQGGAQATEDGSIGLPQGQAVGGSSLINDAICFRPPEEIVERWRAYGVDIDWEQLNRYADEVEARMGVVEIGQWQINRANYLVGLGAARLGWKGERLRHNSPGCIQCGFRHIGCSYDVKMSMNLTYVTDAVAAGAKLFADTRVDHLEKDGSGWRILTDNGEFRAERVILAAGIVQTPTILLRSGIAAGQKLQFHLQSLAWGDFDDPVDGFAGIPMAYGVTEFSDVYGHTGPGYVMEGVSVQPIAFGVQTQADGELQQEIMQRYRHLAGVLPLIRSNARGQVTLEARRPKIDYPLIKADAERVRHFYIKAAELFKAAGARRVLLAHRKNRWVQSPDPDIKIAPGMQYLYTAHPFGGACRGTTTDGVGRVQDNNNLWVLDASAFPEALGVNPQITIAALALEGADRILNG